MLERLAGRLELGDAVITGLADKHVCQAPGWYRWDASGAEFGQQVVVVLCVVLGD